ncbi:CocE/NonD family hydrolase [Rhodococcus rhodochrous]|uniref:CocE/NonD family hydrolase n=1 Tax=Rhodococcus rhodochrous TaxID=1829 RepID=UPI003FD2EFFA
MTGRSHMRLTPSTSGIQYAGWTPGPPAMHGLGQRMLPDRQIPVDDGVTLHADVYLPEREGRYPAVVSFAAYSTEYHTAGIPTGSNEIGSPPVFTDRGYAPVVVERRGMGRSTGEQVTFFDPQDIDDHAKVIEWEAEQPWCNGEVVLFGTSYYGMTQPAVAIRRPPALKAFFANEICTDLYRHLLYFGGVPGLYFMNIWMGANFTENNYDTRMSPDTRALISHLTNGPLHGVVEKVVHEQVDRMFRKFMSATPVEKVREIYAGWMFDAKTRDHDSVPDSPAGRLGEIEVPFVVVQNLSYFNLHQFGSYDLFENASTPEDSKWLILAPPAYDLPVYSWQEEALAFFDHVLRGTDNGYDGQAPVRYWIEGADRFGAADAFPPREAAPLRLHLGSGGEDSAIHRLSRDVTEAGSNTWVAVPIGVPVLGGLDDVAVQTLTFELTIETEMQLTGAITAHLSFGCNEIDSYVVARLSRVDGAGRRHQLSMGAIRPAARTIEAEHCTGAEVAIDSGIRTPLIPNEPVDLHFSLTPAPTRLLPGDTLRFDIGSRTDLLRSSPSEGWVHFDLPVPPYLSRNTVHFGGASWIEVDRI